MGERPLLGSQALPQARDALEYARAAHAGQRRQADGAPFIRHPREVASLLYEASAPDHLIAAGALHDVIEKSGVSVADLRKRFGNRIATLVAAVSEDERVRGYTARKAALRDQVARAGDEALTLFAADKISKVRELRIPGYGVHRPPRLRLAHYQRCLTLLQEHVPQSPLVAQLRAELDEATKRTQRLRRGIGRVNRSIPPADEIGQSPSAVEREGRSVADDAESSAMVVAGNSLRPS